MAEIRRADFDTFLARTPGAKYSLEAVQGQLIYGTGSLHRLATARQRQQAIAAACDAGITAFDLAPAYGNGIDEMEVGIALKGRRSGFTLNTKYGIPIAAYGSMSRHVFAVRRLVDKMTGQSARAYRRRDFSPTMLRTSLEKSLRRLGTDHVDALFIHEPVSHLTRAQLDDIIACGARMKAEGQIRSFGVAGPMQSLMFCPSLSGFDVVQTRCTDLESILRNVSNTPLILYSVYDAFRATARTDFREFLHGVLARHKGTSAIVTSRHVERIHAFKGLLE